jgi:hypothetical protein
MEKQTFIDRILETENLTDELEDSDANWLLNWGIARLDEVLKDATDPNIAAENVTALMAVIRKINRIVGSLSTKDPQELAADLAALRDLQAQAFGPSRIQARALTTAKPDADAARLSRLSSRQALEFLAQSSG